MSNIKFKELLSKLNENPIIQVDDIEEQLHSILGELGESDFKIIKHGLGIDEHRWYERSVTVVEVAGGLLGVGAVTKMYSEMTSYSDLVQCLDFYEMEEVQTISYREVKPS